MHGDCEVLLCRATAVAAQPKTSPKGGLELDPDLQHGVVEDSTDLRAVKQEHQILPINLDLFPVTEQQLSNSENWRRSTFYYSSYQETWSWLPTRWLGRRKQLTQREKCSQNHKHWETAHCASRIWRCKPRQVPEQQVHKRLQN